MCKYISCGKFDKKFFFLFCGNFLIFLLLYSTLFSLGIISNNDSTENLNILFYLLLFYTGQSLFILPEIIINKCIFKEKNKKVKQKSQIAITYIYTNLIELSQRDKLIIFCMSFVIFIVDFSKLLIIKRFKNPKIEFFSEIYTTFLLLYLYIFSKILYKMKYYKHQKIPILFIVISSLIMTPFKITYNLEMLFLFLYQVICSFLDAMIIIYIKYLMISKYFSHFKATYVFGIINTGLLMIVYIIISFIPCNLNICNIKYNGKNYIDNIFYIFSNLNVKTLILSVLSSILFGFISFIFNYVIELYTVCCIFLVVRNKDELLDSIHLEKIDLNIALKCIDYLITFLQLIAICIFKEWLELHFCGLDENIKSNIQNRAVDDLNIDIMNTEDILQQKLEGNNEEINDIDNNGNEPNTINN